LKKIIIIAAALIGSASSVTAQEAYFAQIGQISVSINAPIPVGLSVADIQAQLALVISETLVVRAKFNVDLLPEMPTIAPTSDIGQTGFGHSAAVQQQGIQAALIRQSGNSNTASIQQRGGAMNRASVIQASSNAQAHIVQNGSNNMAYIVQR
jgi:hypothetical protein